MESSKCRVVCWCDLPPELLPIIAGFGETRIDIILFRSVCRSWRLALPLPSNHILSPLFPLPISFHDRKPSTLVTANAVYLVRHRRDHSKIRMLSVQEIHPGKLRLQHPLCFETTIPGSSGNILHLSEWIVTQIHTCYVYNGHQWQRKVVFPDSTTTSTALCGHPRPEFRWPAPQNSLWSFKTEEEGNIYASQLSPFVHRGREIEDFVSFNGRIYLSEAAQGYDAESGDVSTYDILMFDYKTSQLLGIVCDNLHGYLLDPSIAWPHRVRFVVADGDLYMVLKASLPYPYPYPDPEDEEDVCLPYRDRECRVYRLVRDDIINVPTGCKWERVEDLGDRVFFINPHCSFSVSARDLPPPWKGNSIVFSLFNHEYGIELWELGAAKQISKPWSKGYTDLFNLHLELVHPSNSTTVHQQVHFS